MVRQGKEGTADRPSPNRPARGMGDAFEFPAFTAACATAATDSGLSPGISRTCGLSRDGLYASAGTDRQERRTVCRVPARPGACATWHRVRRASCRLPPALLAAGSVGASRPGVSAVPGNGRHGLSAPPLCACATACVWPCPARPSCRRPGIPLRPCAVARSGRDAAESTSVPHVPPFWTSRDCVSRQTSSGTEGVEALLRHVLSTWACRKVSSASVTIAQPIGIMRYRTEKIFLPHGRPAMQERFAGRFRLVCEHQPTLEKNYEKSSLGNIGTRDDVGRGIR